MKPWVSGLLGGTMGALGGIEQRFGEERKQDDAMEIERYRAEKAMEAQQLRNEGSLAVAKVSADAKTAPVSPSDRANTMKYFITDTTRYLTETGLVPAGMPMKDIPEIIGSVTRKMQSIPEGDPRRKEYQAILDRVQEGQRIIGNAEVSGQLAPVWEGIWKGSNSLLAPTPGPAENVTAPTADNEGYLDKDGPPADFKFRVVKREKND